MVGASQIFGGILHRMSMDTTVNSHPGGAQQQHTSVSGDLIQFHL